MLDFIIFPLDSLSAAVCADLSSTFNNSFSHVPTPGCETAYLEMLLTCKTSVVVNGHLQDVVGVSLVLQTDPIRVEQLSDCFCYFWPYGSGAGGHDALMS